MIVRSLNDMEDRTVSGETWTSRRLLLAGDRCRFSLHDTILGAGTETRMWYQNHVEAVYCIEGRGRIIDHDHGDEVHEIEPGVLYVLNGHEKHTLIADEQLRMVCVFDPPVAGEETHDDTGAYPLHPLSAEVAARPTASAAT